MIPPPRRSGSSAKAHLGIETQVKIAKTIQIENFLWEKLSPILNAEGLSFTRYINEMIDADLEKRTSQIDTKNDPF